MSRRGALRQFVSAIFAVLLVSAGIPLGSAAPQQSSCSAVTVDAFRVSNSTIQAVNETGSGTVTERNVRVTVEETDSFVRLRVRNPNGYCVRTTVEISSEIVTPAELGTVDAAKPEGSDVSAEWRAMHSLSEDELYTEVEFEAPAGADGLLFAPSKLRVRSLSWTGEAKGDANSSVQKVREILGMNEDLQQRSYSLEANQSGDIVSVSLKSTDGREVEEWHALYEDENGEWHPVQTDTSSPVFYTEQKDMVKFHYNNQTTVEFTANPTLGDKTNYELRSYLSSINRLLEGITR